MANICVNIADINSIINIIANIDNADMHIAIFYCQIQVAQQAFIKCLCHL